MGNGGQPPADPAAPAAAPAAPAAAPQDAAPAAAPSGTPPAAAAPAAPQSPPAASPQATAGAPVEPTDEQIWEVLTSPKALPSIQMVAGMIDTPPATAANGSVVAPAAPNAAAPSATEAQTAELQRRAGEGDEEAKASLYDMRVTEDAKVEAQTAALGEARKDVMGKLFQTPALTNLSAAEQGRLVTALATGGETAFMNAAMEIGVQRTGGGAPAAAPPAQVAAAAAGYQAVQSAQAQGAPVIPAAAAPVDGGAPINVTEGKSATDVLDDFFSSQGQ